MVTQTCRRCSKMVTMPEPGILTSIKRVLDFSIGLHRNIFGEPTPEMILCPECKESLRQWYMSGKENFNVSSNPSETCAADQEG